MLCDISANAVCECMLLVGGDVFSKTQKSGKALKGLVFQLSVKNE